MTLINVVLTAVIIFVIVPTSNKTTDLVAKVASIIDLELESPDGDSEDSIAVSDIGTFAVPDKLQINLLSTDDVSHYAIMSVTLSINKKNKDTADLEPLITDNVENIKEIVTDEFSKYSMDNVKENKNIIKQNILTRIQELFKSDFIINVSFGNIIYN
jgi:flagellar FliL protein